MWCRLLDRSSGCCQQTQPAHSACTTSTRQESAKEIGCFQAEKGQQEVRWKILYGELQVGKRSHCGQKKRYKDTLKISFKESPLRNLTYQQSHGNRLRSSEQSYKASYEEVLVNKKQKESAKPSRNLLSGTSVLRHHQQSFLPQTSLVLSATGSYRLDCSSSLLCGLRAYMDSKGPDQTANQCSQLMAFALRKKYHWVQ